MIDNLPDHVKFTVSNLSDEKCIISNEKCFMVDVEHENGKVVQLSCNIPVSPVNNLNPQADYKDKEVAVRFTIIDKEGKENILKRNAIWHIAKMETEEGLKSNEGYSALVQLKDFKPDLRCQDFA